MAADRHGRGLSALVTRPSAGVARFWPASAVAAGALLFAPMPAGVALQGLILGLVGALVAVGMALLYRSNRILNFAQADLGAAPAVFAVCLVLYSGLNWFLAVAIGAAGALAVGGVVELVIIRRFFRAPR